MKKTLKIIGHYECQNRDTIKTNNESLNSNNFPVLL